MSDRGAERTFTEEEVAAAIDRAAPHLDGPLTAATREHFAALLATAPRATPDQVAVVREAFARTGAQVRSEAS